MHTAVIEHLREEPAALSTGPIPRFPSVAKPRRPSHADVEGWEGRCLVKRYRSSEIVPSATEGEPQGAVLYFLQSLYSCLEECVQRDKGVS